MRVIGFLFLGLAASAPHPVWASNTPNPPTFLWIDLCTNCIGRLNEETGFKLERCMNPETVDIGVDLDADGTVDRWLSNESPEYFGRGGSGEVTPQNWRRFLIRLDGEAGRTAKLIIVDRSPDHYIAVNAIRLNNADGVAVPNPVPNGFFEDETPLAGWSVTGGSAAAKEDLLFEDGAGEYTVFGGRFFSTHHLGNGATAVVESEPFELSPPNSFVYGLFSGGVSELWTVPGGEGSDNASYVFIDVESETVPLNGAYDEGNDIPVTGFYARAPAVEWHFHPVFVNTSGFEGRRARIVGVDDSFLFHIGLDGFRMNWDSEFIPNSGFDEGLPPDWFGVDDQVYEFTEHPGGKIPGWDVALTGDGSAWFFDINCNPNVFSGRSYIGTGGARSGPDRERTGVKVISTEFTIEPIPDPSTNPFVQLATCQNVTQTRRDGHTKVALQVDGDGDGAFTAGIDDEYRIQNQGFGWNWTTPILDSWHYPEYRFYISPEHYGMNARIIAEDRLTGSYGWMGIDDVFVWDGTNAVQPFENADFEKGDLTHWTTVNSEPEYLRSWLSGSENAWLAGHASHRALNDAPSIAQGDFAADSADHFRDGGNGGDAATGSIASVWFGLPGAPSPVTLWDLY